MYMAPERIKGLQYSFPSDVWALGLIAYECAIGTLRSTLSGLFTRRRTVSGHSDARR
jgi:serine/threonine protein kinase